jgi:hypothetical protein
MTSDTRSLGRRWLDFWFAPADPTTLGFMRLITGILIIYIHLSYCFDLQSFFGKDGWYGLADVNAERREYPWTELGSGWDDEISPPGYIPEYPHRRKAVVQYYRTLAAMPSAERKNVLEFLWMLQSIDTTPSERPAAGLIELLPFDFFGVRNGLDYLERIPTNPLARKNRFDMIVDPKLATGLDRVPTFLDGMPDAERVRMRNAAEVFLNSLPAAAEQRRYVLNHFSEITNRQRFSLLRFLTALPDDPVERDQLMNYLEKWNNDRTQTQYLGWPIFSIWFHVSDPTEMAVAHTAILGIMVMFAIGLFTRVTAIITWMAAVSYIHRTSQVLFGMDTMMNLLLIYLAIGPSGKALSVDRWLACRRARKQGLTPDVERFLARPPKSRTAGFAQRLIQVHFCFIYMAAGLSKLKGVNWWSHHAFWDFIANPEFSLIRYEAVEEVLRKVVAIRPLYAALAAFTVIFTFIMEIGLPFLIWTRLRPIMFIGACFFHFGIGVFMGLILFGLLMMTLLLSYMPGEVIRKQLFGADIPSRNHA